MKNSRDKILKAAVAVFSRRGFHQAQVEEIAKKAGVGKGTIYLHFPNKAMLFAAAVSEGLEHIMAALRRELDSDVHFPEHFRMLIDTSVTLYLKHGDLAKILINELSSGIDPAAMKEIQAVRERFITFIAQILEQGSRDGYIKPVDFRMAAAGVVGLMGSLCSFHFNNRTSTDRAQIVDTMHAILSGGLLA
jgi:TetR/AcrR family fatty acid metabolism transcriptional regulator